MEQEADNYKMEHWYNGFTQDLKSYADRLDDILNLTIIAFESNIVGELAKIEKLILDFRHLFEQSECKKQMAYTYYDHQHTPSLCGPAEQMAREVLITERVRAIESALRHQMNTQKNEEMAELKRKKKNEINRIKKILEDKSEEKTQRTKAQLEREYSLKEDNCRTRTKDQINNEKADLRLKAENAKIANDLEVLQAKTE